MEKTTQEKPVTDFEERALGYFRKNRVPLTIVLSTENQLHCAITSFTRYTVSVVDLDDQREIVLYKHGIVSIEHQIDYERWEQLKRPPEAKPPVTEE